MATDLSPLACDHKTTVRPVGGTTMESTKKTDPQQIPKPACKLRSNGSIMSDSGDNLVWYVGADGMEYEHHIKSDTWYCLGKW